MHNSLKAAIYCRVSTEEQAKEGFSIASQKKVLTEYASSKGWQVTRIYVDEGISGKSMNRPAFLELLKDASQRLFHVILVWKINRFSRKNSDLLNTADYLCKYGINLVSYSEQFDASTPSGKLMLSMLGSIGEFERDTIVENIRAGMVERARQGLFNGGRVLGYDMVDGKLVMDPKESEVVKRIFELYLSGFGYSAIARLLTEEGVKTKNNYTFGINSIKRILKNPIYSGYIYYGSPKGKNHNGTKQTEVTVQGNHLPIISKYDFEMVQRKILSKCQSYLNPEDYLLSKLLRCPVCTGKMTGHTSGRKKDGSSYRYYVCISCKKNNAIKCTSGSVNAEYIESLVLEYLYHLLPIPKIVEDVYKKIECISGKVHPAGNDVNALEKELASKRMSLERLLHLYEVSYVDYELLKKRISSVNDELRYIQSKIETAKTKSQPILNVTYEKVYKSLTDFRLHFNTLDNSIKKRLLHSLIEEISLDFNKQIKEIRLCFPGFLQNDNRYTGCNVKCDVNA